MQRQPAVYILANRCRGTLYTGVTSDLIRRVWDHKTDAVAGFTRRYAIHSLVYYEQHATMLDAIAREKQIKAGKRSAKIRLIETGNPHWRDLYLSLI